MCAILDNDVVGQVFGPKRPEAGEKFFEWLNSGRGRLVVGGRLRQELSGNNEFRRWLQQALLAGRAADYDEGEVKDKTKELKNAGACRSDDPHTVALAQVSGARLLFTNDAALKEDFADKKLIDNPRGKVYTTLRKKRSGKRYETVPIENFQESHKRLLGNRSLCKRK